MTRTGEILMMVILWALALPVLATDAGTVGDVDTNMDEQTRVSAAIAGLLEPTNKLRGQDDQIAEIAAALVAAGRAHAIPVMLLVSMAHHETRFRGHLVGGLGEVGIIQVHGVARRGCDLSSVEGQAMCGAAWLRRMADHCGDLESGLTAYAVGACSAEHGSRAFYAVRRRLRLYTRLETEAAAINTDTGGERKTTP